MPPIRIESIFPDEAQGFFQRENNNADTSTDIMLDYSRIFWAYIRVKYGIWAHQCGQAGFLPLIGTFAEYGHLRLFLRIYERAKT